MLTNSEERVASANVQDVRAAQLAKITSIEWLGQMAASVFWICSVLVYGITSNGDWLQLLAATSWCVANIASVLRTQVDEGSAT